MSSEAMPITTDGSDHYILPLSGDIQRRYDEAAKELGILDAQGQPKEKADAVIWREVDAELSTLTAWYSLVVNGRYAKFPLVFEHVDTDMMYTVGPVEVVNEPFDERVK